MSAVLHDYRRSTASYRVRIALALADIPWRTVAAETCAEHPAFVRAHPDAARP